MSSDSFCRSCSTFSPGQAPDFIKAIRRLSAYSCTVWQVGELPNGEETSEPFRFSFFFQALLPAFVCFLVF